MLYGISGFYPEDIREFHHYNLDDEVMELVEYLFSLGYGVRQVEGFYDLYVGDMPRYRGEPFVPDPWTEADLRSRMDEYQVELDLAVIDLLLSTFPADIIDLEQYDSDHDFREWIQYLNQIGYGFRQMNRGYELYVL